MAEMLTKAQKQAVIDRGGKLLVSAAAGSGKTKVLVDRLLSYITDTNNPANIDDFLIITYTKAAAAELRGKIAAKLSEQIAETPNNRHLQQQMRRLYLAKISTVHSFCADVLREHSFYLDFPADFRVADENECLEMQLQEIEKLLDKSYAVADNDPNFRAFIDSQGFGRDDRQIPAIILKVYNSARCHLNPEQWLQWCEDICTVDVDDDASNTVWGRYLIDDLHAYLDLQIRALQYCINAAAMHTDFEKPLKVLNATLDQLVILRACQNWDDIRQNMYIDYGRLVFSSKCKDLALVDGIKAVRNACKDGLTSKLRRFSDNSVQILVDVTRSSGATCGLIDLVREFSVAYDKRKRMNRVMDFSDLEHRMLDLLLGKGRTGPTATAVELGKRYREVMVDEYQDTNAVQDAIFETLTIHRNNCFMVGDVKQSIYQFRLADPSIFLKKYEAYLPAEVAKVGQGRKVLLSSNFRSSGAVIQAVNTVFSTVMSPRVGGLYYSDTEALKEGIPHIHLPEPEIEFYGIDVQENTYPEEARVVAERIEQLLDGTHMVRDGENLRPITADDIVILLRSPGSVGGEFAAALAEKGIRCAMGGAADLLSTEEIEVLRALLMVISNPTQDIPLVAVLSSRVFGFTADELAAIRAVNPKGSLYNAVESFKTVKSNTFIAVLNRLRSEAKMCTLSRLLTKIYALTRIDSIYSALPDGMARVENLYAFYQIVENYECVANNDLERFLEHLVAMEEKGIAAPETQRDSGVVTIMSIHKSKGLEFPVVFLSGLARSFNYESARAQVLCDKELGLGLLCVDVKNRVRYPSIAKRAISCKILSDGLSEEMRVLYVAMTRARDRLIMTYAARNLERDCENLRLRLKHSDPLLVSMDADCPGIWILVAAMAHSDNLLQMRVLRVSDAAFSCEETVQEVCECMPDVFEQLQKSLDFSYPHRKATTTHSKQTATQLKGRNVDYEAAEATQQPYSNIHIWRTPSFVGETVQGRMYGSAMHTVMQYLRLDRCGGCAGISKEVSRLAAEGYITKEQAAIINVNHINAFFHTDVGCRFRSAKKLLREFKFSILDDAKKYNGDVLDEQVLLQGVVDCAIIDDNGITIVDFKTDKVSFKALQSAVERYRAQISVYADALTRIFQLPIKDKYLYFFELNRLVEII